MKKASTLALLLMIMTPFWLAATEQKPITAENLWEVKRVGAPVASPDGKLTVFTVTEFSIGDNNSKTHLHLMDNESGAIKQITFAGSEGAPVWSPDGSQIAFTSRRNGAQAQLYILPLQGGEAKKVTDLPVGTYAPKWFPDGKKLAFAANIHPDYNGDWNKLKEIQKQQNENKVTAKVTEDVMYRFWDRWLTNGFYPRLFSLEIASGEVTDLMPGVNNFFNMMGGVSYDIAPNGQQIALSMNVTQPPYDRLNYDIFLLSTDGSGKMTNITESNPADDLNPVFSPDGRQILYGKKEIYHFYADRVVMALHDLLSGAQTALTHHIDLSCDNWFFSADGRTIFFEAEDRAMQSLFSIPAKGGSHKELFRGGTNGNAALAGPRHLVFNHHNLSAPPELYKLDLRRGQAQKMTSFNDDLMAGIKLGKTENITYKGANGADVQMFIQYPPDYDPTKKYPLVLMIHGGPHGIFGDSFHFRWNSQLFAAPGYIAAMPNFHGSTSFGNNFTMSIHGSHANQPFEDIMKATDYLIERGLVDETKMAATGGSYGGYMVSWIAGHTDRYAALVNHAGVYDLHLQFASDYSGNRAYQYGGSPWENFDQLNANNPAQFAHNFKTPMLVIHGELDYRVPVAHGFLVYGIYRSMGLDSRLVYFPDENHWILKPQNSIYWYQELHNWLERYLK
ncbi:S9 family peptidase [Alkaliflexus imshenetskii]|uniref:S9 family peptidase n=1 Tax=Alkaliflexus imshenetskii TaxID=286730 RepID=UPI00047C4321|nr:S9 family peptidase [Alkaliflexus imshenetskii]